MPNSRHTGAIRSPSSSREMNFRRSSMGLHTFQGILRSPQKAQLCNPCLRNELSPLSQEGQRSLCFLGIIRQFNSFVLPHWYQAVGSMVRVVGMGLIQNEHGVRSVRRKVPKRLEEAVARVQGVPKTRQPWLKRSLRTKDEKRAKLIAKPVMMEFDRIIAEAETIIAERPVRTELTEAEIKQISDYFYAYQLHEDDDLRADGVGDDPLFADIHRQLTEAGIEFETPFEIEENRSGLSDRMMNKIEGAALDVLPVLR